MRFRIARSLPTLLLPAVLVVSGFDGVSAQEFEALPRAAGVRFPVELAPDPAPRPMRAPAAGALAAGATGEFPVLAIPALFSDSPEPAVSAAQIQEILFAGEGRTLRTFYEEMSFGRLSIRGAVADWVRTPVTRLDAAGEVEGHGWIGSAAGEHFAAAIAAADPEVDFTRYDSDGPDGIPDSGDDDGFVDAVTFKFTEVAGSCGGPGFWPHRGNLRDPSGAPGVPTDDIGHDGEPIRVRGYTTESVVECDGETPQGPATSAHEFGHVLGLPDFYRMGDGLDPLDRRWGVGCFGLMSAGSWGCGTEVRVQGFGPSGFSPLSRDILGWGEATVVEDVQDAEYVLEPAQATGQYLKIPQREDGSEYLLVEYRPRMGLDDAHPADGVLVYRVLEDEGIFGGAFSSTLPYRLVEADGDDGLSRPIAGGGNRGVETDVFAQAGAVDSVTPATRPSTHLPSRPAPSNVWIHSISVEGGVARIRISTANGLTASPVVAPISARALEPLEVRYRLDDGVPPYEAVPPPEGLPDGLSMRMDGDEVVIEGAPLWTGLALPLQFHVRDADGASWWATHVIDLLEAELTEEQLMSTLAASGSVSTDIARYLDNTGNGNGVYDVGDLRAYLGRTAGQNEDPSEE